MFWILHLGHLNAPGQVAPPPQFAVYRTHASLLTNRRMPRERTVRSDSRDLPLFEAVTPVPSQPSHTNE
eukprot:6139652-Pleurochrysis_carterae.AAC.1